jgi:hypothetical protein
MIPIAAPLIMSGIGMIGKAIGRSQANSQMRKLLADQPKYEANPLATTMLNARMPGAVQAERNIYGEQANMLGRAQQAATSSSDIMQQLSGAQAQTNQAFQGLAGMEATDYQRRYGNYISEKEKEYQDKLRQYQVRAQLEGAIQENRQNTMGDIANTGMGLANFIASGGFLEPEKNRIGEKK